MITARARLAASSLALTAMAVASSWPGDATAREAGIIVAQRSAAEGVDVRAAITALRSSDPAVRAEAGRTLAGLHFSKFSAVTAEDVAILAEVLQKGDVEARRAAAGTFAQLSHSTRGGELTRGVIGPVIAALKDSDATVASYSATALGHARDPASIGPLIQALADPRLPVARSAGASVGHLIDEKNAALVVSALRYEHARKPIAGVLSGLAPPPFAELSAALTSRDVELRRGAAFALSQISDQRTRGALTQALADPDPEVRLWAATAMIRVGDPSVVEPLSRLLNDPDVKVRQAAASSLRTGGPAAVDKLIASLKDPDQRVRQQAGVSLVAIGDSRAVPPLLEIFRSPDAPDYLTFDLGHWKRSKEIVVGLVEIMASSDASTRRRAAQALSIDNAKVVVLGRAGVQPLVAALKSPDVEVRRAAALSLRTLSTRGLLGPGDAAALEQATKDPDQQVSHWASAALGRMEQLRRGARER